MPRFGPTGTVGTSDDPNFAPTLRLVEQTLAGAPTLPGAVPAVHAPTAALTAPFGYRADGNLIDRAAFWTAPGTPTDAIEYLTTNLPFGMTLSGTGSSGHTKTDRMEKQVVMYDGPVTSPSQWLELQISVVRSGSGVAVRADATGVWLPTKPAAEYIGTVSTVDVTVYRPTASAGDRRRQPGRWLRRRRHRHDQRRRTAQPLRQHRHSSDSRIRTARGLRQLTTRRSDRNVRPQGAMTTAANVTGARAEGPGNRLASSGWIAARGTKNRRCDDGVP